MAQTRKEFEARKFIETWGDDPAFERAMGLIQTDFIGSRTVEEVLLIKGPYLEEDLTSVINWGRNNELWKVSRGKKVPYNGYDFTGLQVPQETIDKILKKYPLKSHFVATITITPFGLLVYKIWNSMHI